MACRCNNCLKLVAVWRPRCPFCAKPHSLFLHAFPGTKVDTRLGLLGDDATDDARVLTGVKWLDDFVGGGLPRGRVTCIYGRPSCGKSRVSLHAAIEANKLGAKVLYITAEEKVSDLDGYAAGWGYVPTPTFWRMQNVDPDEIAAAIERVMPDLVVVDSWQELWAHLPKSPESKPGSFAQMTHAYTPLANKRLGRLNYAFILMGQVNSQGEFAGALKLLHRLDSIVLRVKKNARDVRNLRVEKTRSCREGEINLVMDARGILVPAPPSAPPTARGKGRKGKAANDDDDLAETAPR